MPQINYDKDTAANNVVEKISRSTGINNFSDSSKLTYMASVLSEEVSTFIEVVSDTVKNMYSSSAEGRYLDIKGAENSVFRNTISSLDIVDTDLVVKIEPRGDGEPFSSIVTRNITIYPGEEITSGSQFKIVFTKQLSISSSTGDLYASVRIESLDRESGFKINQDDIFKFPTTFLDLSSIGSLVQLRFVKPISLLVDNEEDEEFRGRVIFSRDNPNIAIAGAIQAMVQDVPNISGAAIYTEERGTGTIDIGITTNDLQLTGEDTLADYIKSMIEIRMRSVVAHGVNYEIFIATPLYLRVEYDYNSSIEIPESTIVDAIYTAFNNIYAYSNLNIISAEALGTEVESSLPSLESLSIQSLSLFDPQINEYISFGDIFAIGPKGTFITINKEDIVRSS